jgi:hypothetical protein
VERQKIERGRGGGRGEQSMTATEIEVQEKPILFSGAMVRKIIEGLKNNTRRVMDRPPLAVEPYNTPNVFMYHQDGTPLDKWYRFDKETDGLIETRRCPGYSSTKRAAEKAADWLHSYRRGEVRWSRDEIVRALCPYGKPGDRLWVRESWYQSGEHVQSHPEDDEYRDWSARGRQHVFYAADGIPSVRGKNDWGIEPGPNPKERKFKPDEHRWYWRSRPSIHMPRWASRLTLEIVSVKVERVQEIGHRDIAAEGVGFWSVESSTPFTYGQHKKEFEILWDSINAHREGGKYAWAANPWVWAIEFKKHEGPTA